MMDFFKYLNIPVDRKKLIDFVESIDDWQELRCRRTHNVIKGVDGYRYRSELFECDEIKRLAEMFEIGYDKVQITRFYPDFNFPPHTDLERQTVVLVPILPVFNYNPLIYNHMDEEYCIHYYGPIAADTTLEHSLKANGEYRINLQFDLDISLDEVMKKLEK